MKKLLLVLLVYSLNSQQTVFAQAAGGGAGAGDAAAATSTASIPPKAKAFIIVAGYGTVGGALLGFASLAFGKKPRAIAQGASLGLYAGIIFGAYIVLSYQQPAFDNTPYYDDYGEEPFGFNESRLRDQEQQVADFQAGTGQQNYMDHQQKKFLSDFSIPLVSFRF
jgi:hypothetical protein